MSDEPGEVPDPSVGPEPAPIGSAGEIEARARHFMGEVVLNLANDLAVEQVPERVYHYTSPEGLLGIIQSGGVWASDVRFVNDGSELSHFSGVVHQVCDEMPASGVERELLDVVDRGFLDLPKSGMYVASFSARSDLLSQWRAYCPSQGGFALGFEVDELRRLSNYGLMRCLYDRGEQRRLCRKVLERACYVLRRESERDSGESRRERAVAYGLSAYAGLIFLAVMSKHESFAEEQEWRIPVSEVGHPTLRPRFRPGRGGIVPYLQLPPDGHTPVVPSHIVVGPSPHAELAAQSARRVVELGRGRHPEVTVSLIPYRA